MRGVLSFLVLLGLLAVATSYGGGLHPAGDSLAVFRPLFALGVILLGLLLRSRVWLWAAFAGLVALLPIIWMARPLPAPSEGLRVYQKNLLFRMQNPERVIADIRDSGADIILLQELARDNRPVIREMKVSHPYWHMCDAHSVGGVAIMSRLPFTEPPVCDYPNGLVAVRLETEAGPLSVAAVHLHWPWPFGQARHVQRMLPYLEALPKPVLVGGDFNMVPWSHTNRLFEAATGTVAAGPVRPSLLLEGVYPMPIDQVLVPEGWSARVQMRDRFGSDHRGVLLDMTCAACGEI